MKDFRKLFKKYIRESKSGKSHAVLSASGSERWLGCPGSIRMSKGLPQVDNEHSIRGTNTHTLFQFIVENHMVFREALAHKSAKEFKEHIGFDDAMLANALFAAEFVWREKAKLEKETGVKAYLEIEKKVELEGVGHGTADVILYQPFGVLHVMDYKNGQKTVEAQENTQGLYYAHAAADHHGWDFAHLEFTIIQPNASHKQGPVRTWKTTLKRLEQAGRVFREGAKRTRDPDAPLVTDSKWCWFCPARAICPEQMKIKEANIMDRFQAKGGKS